MVWLWGRWCLECIFEDCVLGGALVEGILMLVAIGGMLC